MKSRDTEQASSREQAGGIRIRPGEVIRVEGGQWAPATNQPAKGDAALGERQPLQITFDITCANSCMATTCGASCSGGPTCRPTPSCHWPAVTCSGFTCTDPTCSGPSCSVIGPTCGPLITCVAGVTCSEGATCMAGACPTTIYEVKITPPGVVQISFDNTSSFLLYTLEYSANVPKGPWIEVVSALGNSGVMSLWHTNQADRSFYRLRIQNPQ